MRQKIALAALLCGLGLAGCTPNAPTASPAPPPAPAPAPAPVPAAPPRPAAPQPTAAAPDGLPDGPGRAETVAACSGCHGLGQILGEHRDRAAWTTTVTSMINNGAPVADADFDKVVGYLAAHFGPG
jgi:quinoprotein glucose dehydrogenase